MDPVMDFGLYSNDGIEWYYKTYLLDILLAVWGAINSAAVNT